MKSFLVIPCISLLLTACGGGGGSNPPLPGNAAPVARVNAPESALEQNEFSLDASDSTDDGSSLTYAWVQVDGEPVQVEGESSAVLQVRAPEVSIDAVLSFKVTVTDPEGLSDTETVEVTILDTFRFQALLGPIAGADVALREYVDGDLLYSTVTAESDDLDIAGTFQVPRRLIEPARLYTISVSGGRDIDPDDDGRINDEAIPFAGKLRAVISAGDMGPDSNTVNALTELAFRELEAAGADRPLNELDAIAARILDKDLNGDGVTDRKDLLVFEPAKDDDAYYLGAEALAQVSQNVLNAENADPMIVLAVSDFSVEEEQVVTLDASESYDIDSLSLSFAWTQVAGPVGRLANNDGALLAFTAPNIAGTKEVILRLAVSDGGGGSATLDISIEVTGDNDPPVLGTESTILSAENQQTVTAFKAVDPEGEVVETILVGGDDVQFFSLRDGDTLQFLAPPDFENPQDLDRDNQYNLQIVVTDPQGLSAEHTLNIRVTDITQLVMKVAFPLPASNFGGADVIHVSGQLEDEEDGEVLATDLTSLQVNGFEASLDLDDSRTWHAEVPTDGQVLMTLNVSMLDAAGGTSEFQQEVRNFTVTWPGHLVRRGNEVFILDTGLPGIRMVDLGRNSSRVVSVFDSSAPRNLTGFAMDEAGARLLVADAYQDSIVAVDIASGAQTLLTGMGKGAGPDLEYVRGLVIDQDRHRLLATDTTLSSIVAVDVLSGDRSIFSNNELAIRGTIQIDHINNRIFTTEQDTIIATDLETGSREVIGSIDGSPVAMIYEEDTNRLVMAIGNALVALDLATGERRLVSSRARGDGPRFYNLRGLIAAPDAGRLLAIDEYYGLFAVDGADGGRELVLNPRAGSGKWVHYANDVAFDNASDRIVVSGASESHFDVYASPVQVDPETGERSRFGRSSYETLVAYGDAFIAVSGGRIVVLRVSGVGEDSAIISDEVVGAGPPLAQPFDLSLDPQRDRVIVTNSGAAEVLAVDLASGDRTVISGDARGFGVPFQNITSIDVDPQAEVAYVTDEGLEVVLKVDLATGNRIRMCHQPGDVAVTRPRGVAIDSINNRALIVDEASDAVIAIDLSSGSCTTHSRSGDGPAFSHPQAVSVDSETQRAFVSQRGFFNSVIQVDLASGQRTVLAN